MASLKQLQEDLAKLTRELNKLDEAAPKVAGVEAVRWINGNFQRESYKGVKWKPRSPKTNKSYDKRNGVKGSVYNSANKILQQSGNLRDSIRSRAVGRTAFVGFDTNRIPYGQIHNEGGRIVLQQRSTKLYFYRGRFSRADKATKSKKAIIPRTEIRMPKRQFMPRPNEAPEPEVLKVVSDKLIFERSKIFNIFKR